MQESIRHTFPKNEKLYGKTRIENLLAKGRRGNAGFLRYCWRANPENECNRIVVSVPKKFFKRAVKGNLLKRRIRESWRLQKHLLKNSCTEVLLTYSTKEIMEFEQIYDAVSQMILRINKSLPKEGYHKDNEE